MSTLFRVLFVSIHCLCNDSDNCEQQDKNTARNKRKENEIRGSTVRRQWIIFYNSLNILALYFGTDNEETQTYELQD